MNVLDTEQYFPVVVFFMPYKVALQKYFRLVLFIFLNIFQNEMKYFFYLGHFWVQWVHPSPAVTKRVFSWPYFETGLDTGQS